MKAWIEARSDVQGRGCASSFWHRLRICLGALASLLISATAVNAHEDPKPAPAIMPVLQSCIQWVEGDSTRFSGIDWRPKSVLSGIPDNIHMQYFEHQELALDVGTFESGPDGDRSCAVYYSFVPASGRRHTLAVQANSEMSEWRSRVLPSGRYYDASQEMPEHVSKIEIRASEWVTVEPVWQCSIGAIIFMDNRLSPFAGAPVDLPWSVKVMRSRLFGKADATRCSGG